MSIEKQLQNEVERYWNQVSSQIGQAEKEKDIKKYFAQLESHRYAQEPEIFSFAQFSRYFGKKVLEVGMGAGVDFLQWVRSGAKAYGVDLSQEAVSHVKEVLSSFKLNAELVEKADAETLPFDSNFFDLVYSWGVIHHSLNAKKCFDEMVRVAKPGGEIKLMVYKRRSLSIFYRYLRTAFLKMKPFRSFSSILFYEVESLGTKGYTFKEVKSWIKEHPVKIKKIRATVTSRDLLRSRSKLSRAFAYLLATFFGWNRCGVYLTVELEKY